MKKLFVLVLVAMVSTVTFAQISWNAKAGINMSKLTGGEGADMKVGYQLGVGMVFGICFYRYVVCPAVVDDCG